MYNWQDGQTMKASDYVRERNVIIEAINESDKEKDYLLVAKLMEVF
jgi:hypothetical protein